MNHQRMTCDPGRIELFLGQKLSEEEQAAFELHLDDCHDCRRRLEAAAAGDDIWSAVRDSLRSEQLPSDSWGAGDSAAGDNDASSSHDTVLKLLAPTDDDRMLGRLGTYEVVGVVGSGGMGIVLKAFDRALNRYVAIKVLAPHLGNSGAARKRFSREAQAAAAVVHDNVMEIYGVADTAGLSYLVMPYVRGPSLQRRLDDDGPLELVEILRIGMQAAAGLAAAHAQGLVHRDVKPANILLADGVERVKLTDFGLARAADDASLTRTGIIAGTPQYMSPEQARGESVDQRSDLFSLGSVLYTMCTGRAPFRAETSYGVLRRITDGEPRPIREINPDIPEWLCRIIAKLMSKRPDDRFRSTQEVAKLLEECLSHVQQPTGVPLPAALPAPAVCGGSKLRKNFWKGTLLMLATFGMALLGMFVMQATDPPDIAGRWSSEEAGQLLLDRTSPGEYSGSYPSAVGQTPGTIELSWSRIQRRFNGTWREGEDCFGELSLRLVDNELRGARTTDPKSKVDPATPRLADFAWKRDLDDTRKLKPVSAEAVILYDSINKEFEKAAKGIDRSDVEKLKSLWDKSEPQRKKLAEMLKGTVAENPYAELNEKYWDLTKAFFEEKDEQKKNAKAIEASYLSCTVDNLLHGKPLPKKPVPTEKPAEPQGPKLIYEIEPGQDPARMTVVMMDGVLNIVERRLNVGAEKMAEVRKLDDRRLEVTLLRQSDADKDRVERLLARAGTLEFRILASERDKEIVAQARKDEGKTEVLALDPSGERLAYWVPLSEKADESLFRDPRNIRRTRKEGEREIREILLLMDPHNVTGAYLTKAEMKEESGQPAIGFTFNKTGGEVFGKLTGDHLPDPSDSSSRYQLGIIIDGKLRSAPTIMSIITEQGQITGNFTEKEAQDVVDILNAGSLPVRLRLVEELESGTNHTNDKDLMQRLIDTVRANKGSIRTWKGTAMGEYEREDVRDGETCTEGCKRSIEFVVDATRQSYRSKIVVDRLERSVDGVKESRLRPDTYAGMIKGGKYFEYYSYSPDKEGTVVVDGKPVEKRGSEMTPFFSTQPAIPLAVKKSDTFFDPLTQMDYEFRDYTADFNNLISEIKEKGTRSLPPDFDLNEKEGIFVYSRTISQVNQKKLFITKITFDLNKGGLIIESQHVVKQDGKVVSERSARIVPQKVGGVWIPKERIETISEPDCKLNYRLTWTTNEINVPVDEEFTIAKMGVVRGSGAIDDGAGPVDPQIGVGASTEAVPILDDSKAKTAPPAGKPEEFK